PNLLAPLPPRIVDSFVADRIGCLFHGARAPCCIPTNSAPLARRCRLDTNSTDIASTSQFAAGQLSSPDGPGFPTDPRGEPLCPSPAGRSEPDSDARSGSAPIPSPPGPPGWPYRPLGTVDPRARA